MLNENLPDGINEISEAEVEGGNEGAVDVTENDIAENDIAENNIAENVPTVDENEPTVAECEPLPVSTEPVVIPAPPIPLTQGSGSESADATDATDPTDDADDADNFLPKDTITWYYSLRDLIDEMFWGLVFIAVLVGMYFPTPTTKAGLYAYHVLTGLFFCGILYFSYLYNPLKIFFRKDVPNGSKLRKFPSLKEILAISLLLLGCVVLICRLPAIWTKVVVPDESTVNTTETTAPTVVIPESAPVSEPDSAVEEKTAVPSEATVDTMPEKVETTTGEETVTSSSAVKVETEKAPSDEETSGDAKGEGKSFWKTVYGVIRKLFLAFVVIYWFNLFVRILFSRVFTHYKLTPVHFIHKDGFLVSKTRRIAIWDIAQANVSRNLWQRIIGVGTVELRIRDHGIDSNENNEYDATDNILYINGLKDPTAVVDEINRYRLFIRRRMGRRFLTNITQK